jgi:uncharacterized protein YyaL (SSP411 family)
MEKESFEDEAAAELLNKSFISVKVDREERPDIDNIYMMVCQMMNGSGGWPLSVFMTPDKKPFFAGTYFPKESGFGRTGFIDLLNGIAEAWDSRQEEVIKNAGEIALQLKDVYTSGAGGTLEEKIFNDAYSGFEKSFDKINGGFGSAPKFPSPHNLIFLLRFGKRSGSEHAFEMAYQTLAKMRLGGIFDQIGSGFHRYSTDSRWLAPHFEKMLYDQALLMMAYTEAYQIGRSELFKRTVEEISAYVLRDMTAPGGGYYSAEDADSEGEEGKFYLWSEEELLSVLGSEDAGFAASIFNTTRAGNFIDPHQKTAGSNILHLGSVPGGDENTEKRLENIRLKLFSTREKRIRPHKDDKVLTDWNGLMIAALAKAGRVFGNQEYILSAERGYIFLEKLAAAGDGKLFHRYKEGKAGLTANLDDYSFLIWALLELYESTFKYHYIEKAVELTKICIEHFWDRDEGGFFFTPDYGEQHIVRTKEYYDGAIPSGNSVLALNLIRLSRITAEPGYENYAVKLFTSASGLIKRNPQSFSQLLIAADYYFGPSFEIVVAGDITKEKTIEILKTLSAEFVPNKVLILKDEKNQDFNPPFGYLKSYNEIDSEPAIYVCKNQICALPLKDAAEALKLLV